MIIDGNVQTVSLDNVNIVTALRGIDVVNSANLPVGQRPAFVFGSNVSVDFPRFEAARINAVNQARFSLSYFHGSREAIGINCGADAQRVILTGCNVTSHAQAGVYFNGYDLDMIACIVDDNSQVPPGSHCGLTVWSAARVSVIGGSYGASPGQPVRHGFGIYRNVGSAAMTLIGPRMQGTIGAKNF